MPFRKRARPIEVSPNQFRPSQKAGNRQSPSWVFQVFLWAEYLTCRGEYDKAFDYYLQLVKHGLNSEAGMSILVGPALWRCLSNDARSNENADILLKTILKLKGDPAYEGIFFRRIYGGLPQLKEDILRRASLLAWSKGDVGNAQTLFMDYMRYARTGEFTWLEKQIMVSLVAEGKITGEELTLKRAYRLSRLGFVDKSKELLFQLKNSPNLKVAVSAAMRLARLMHRNNRGATRYKVVMLLEEVLQKTTSSRTKEEAHFMLFKVLYREGKGRKLESALGNLRYILENFPTGRRVDDALYQLARHYQQGGEFDKALDYYRRIRELKGHNDWVNLSRFQPAILLYSSGGESERSQAIALLQNLLKIRPNGPLRHTALFWLGRIMEERNDTAMSRAYFTKIIEEKPFGYYALRARMHMRMGPAASRSLLPDTETQKMLADAYHQGHLNPTPGEFSIQHRRIGWSLSTGLYPRVKTIEVILRKEFPSKRIEEISLEDLDQSGLFASVCLLMSIRQDCMLAAKAAKVHKKTTNLANAAGYGAGDWTMAMILLARDSKVQRDVSYLATSYPTLYKKYLKKAAEVQNVPIGLLYGIIREESFFSPNALSIEGALGLFQFMPGTFSSLIKKYPEFKKNGWYRQECLTHESQSGD
jgi:tetratricopeptide (TPR) repeat protein